TEGLGVVLLEASACEVPCVTGRSGGTPEAVVDGVTGFVVDARDRDRLAGAIVRLLEDRDLARRLGRSGRRHVSDEFGGRIPKALTQWLE
ncbi:MAG: glycosyltransferase, partial [Actinomycetota bacterium]|nr:glycosyltransferase [Actinomycetota bacterium]